MISIMKGRINVKFDSLQTAIEKKFNNNALSNKSIGKIINIANTQFNLKNGEAEYIFSNIQTKKIPSQESLKKLVNSLNKISTNKASDFMSVQLKLWHANANQALTPVEKEFIGKGSRGKVYRDGDDFIIKKLPAASIAEIEHEANMCNAYNLKKGKVTSVATVKENTIRMPFISGLKVTSHDIFNGVQTLHQMGFMIADACPSNFIKSLGGEVIPIDFGLMFKRNELDSIDLNIKKEIVQDYIKGGYKYIPKELINEYRSCITELDNSLGNESPLRNMNVKALIKAGLL